MSADFPPSTPERIPLATDAEILRYQHETRQRMGMVPEGPEVFAQLVQLAREGLAARMQSETEFRKDAERYRWLRRSGDKQNDIAVAHAEGDLDRAIDFEIAREADRDRTQR